MENNRLDKEKELRKRKSEELHFLYDKLFELIIHEGRYVSERTNAFLIFHGILFAAFSILKVEAVSTTIWSEIGSFGITVIGLVVSFFS